RIAFQAVRGENYDIEVLELASRKRTRLTSGPEFDGQFTWAPDGGRLGFISARDGSEAVFLIRADGGGLTRLTSQAALNPSWSRR
ncbi:MAG TPA: hypothetical protein VJK71_08865, partial [Gemmatimonadales bacterium]|nr:hypothetical protein [Gemmatimonadales bacterium]